MADHRSLALGSFAGFITDAGQQAVTHFTHHCFGTALLRLVLASAEVDAGPVNKPCHVARSVGIAAANAIGQGCDATQTRVISLRHCIRQKLFNFVANAEGLVQ